MAANLKKKIIIFSFVSDFSGRMRVRSYCNIIDTTSHVASAIYILIRAECIEYNVTDQDRQIKLIQQENRVGILYLFIISLVSFKHG